MSTSPGSLSTWRRVRPAARAAVAGAVAFLAAGILARLALPEETELYGALFALSCGVPMGVAIAVGIASGRERAAWAGVAFGLVLTGIAASRGLPTAGAGVVPDEAPALADAVWLLRYPVLYGSLAVLLRARVPPFGLGQALDGLIGAFAAAALFRVAVHPWMVSGEQVPDLAVAIRSAYPLLDVLVLGFLTGAAALNGLRPWVWLPLGLDILLCVVAEAIDTRWMLTRPGEALTGVTTPAYLLCAWFLAAAAFAAHRAPRQVVAPRRPVAPTLLLAAGSIATLVVSASTQADEAVWLASVGLLATLGRLAYTMRENDRLLDLSRAEALTDSLTGLGNRRELSAVLVRAARDASRAEPLTLALFDLDGFKRYNDTFGHPAGDALLERLGGALRAAVEPRGRAFRMGGDEFCVLIAGAGGDHHEVVAAAREALTERGEGFVIGASGGTALLPADTSDPTEALRLADQRMYADKARGRRSATEHEAMAALLQVVRERDPSLGAHTSEVADWAASTALALGADQLITEQARLGGDLHDIGKTAIPDAILNKPGPLDEEEWDFMRRHTLIGERILLADAALAPIAPVARSHHERWDGGGYPDGLGGPDIPIVARIIAVCDAYEAMVADRPYRRGRSHEEAVEELVRCSGTQFDPEVVDAFLHAAAATARVATSSQG